MAQTATRIALADLSAAPALSPLAGMALRAAAALTRWSERRRSRRALAQLDERLLFDIGVDRHAAQAEARRHFWLG